MKLKIIGDGIGPKGYRYFLNDIEITSDLIEVNITHRYDHVNEVTLVLLCETEIQRTPITQENVRDRLPGFAEAKE